MANLCFPIIRTEYAKLCAGNQKEERTAEELFRIVSLCVLMQSFPANEIAFPITLPSGRVPASILVGTPVVAD